MTLILSPDTRHTTGAILLTIVAIEYGGWFMLRIVQGHQPATLVSTLLYQPNVQYARATSQLVLALSWTPSHV